MLAAPVVGLVGGVLGRRFWDRWFRDWVAMKHEGVDFGGEFGGHDRVMVDDEQRRPVSLARVPDAHLETERLRLRSFRNDLSDVDALHAIQSDADHMRYYPHPFSRDETVAWIERQLAREKEHGFALWAIEDKVTGDFLGNCGPMLQEVDGQPELEIGWSVTPTRANQGIATEAASAVKGYCLDVLEQPYVISLVRPENLASARVAEKIGMTVWKETAFGSLGWLHRVYCVASR